MEASEKAVTSLTVHLQEKKWAINPWKVQRPRLSVKFVGVIWSGKTKVLCSTVIGKVQAFPIPTIPKQLQEFWGMLGYLRSFIPPLAQLIKPPYWLTKKKAKYGTGIEWKKETFQQAKIAIKQGGAGIACIQSNTFSQTRCTWDSRRIQLIVVAAPEFCLNPC